MCRIIFHIFIPLTAFPRFSLFSSDSLAVFASVCRCWLLRLRSRFQATHTHRVPHDSFEAKTSSGAGGARTQQQTPKVIIVLTIKQECHINFHFFFAARDSSSRKRENCCNSEAPEKALPPHALRSTRKSISGTENQHLVKAKCEVIKGPARHKYQQMPAATLFAFVLIASDGSFSCSPPGRCENYLPENVFLIWTIVSRAPLRCMGTTTDLMMFFRAINYQKPRSLVGSP